MYILSRIT